MAAGHVADREDEPRKEERGEEGDHHRQLGREQLRPRAMLNSIPMESPPTRKTRGDAEEEEEAPPQRHLEEGLPHHTAMKTSIIPRAK